MNNTVHIPQWGKPQILGWAFSYKDIAPTSPTEHYQIIHAGVLENALHTGRSQSPGLSPCDSSSTELAGSTHAGPHIQCGLSKGWPGHAGRSAHDSVASAIPKPTFLLFSTTTPDYASFAMCSCCAIAYGEERRVNSGVKAEGGVGVKQDRPAGP